MRKFYFLIAALLIFSFKSNSQTIISKENYFNNTKLFGANGLSIISFTDYGKRLSWGGKIYFEDFVLNHNSYSLSYQINSKLHYISGRDESKINTTFIKENLQGRFLTNIITLGFSINNHYSFNDLFNLYLGTGISGMIFTPNTKRVPIDDYSKYALSYDLAIGNKFILNDYFILDISTSVFFTNTDNIDNVDFGSYKDNYLSLNVGLAYRYRADNDKDKDGILDKYDACKNEPEDFDGFEDEDGCPDIDNDFDGILDKDDICPNEKEDKDNYLDYDGCPDLDNDTDGILDVDDKCPNQAEDFDGFEDEDGCPDIDNDGDGILDNYDTCINDPEDQDGYEDEDGCPDIDNDGDGILDKDDKCPNAPETFNNFEDEDGCPDSNSRQPALNQQSKTEKDNKNDQSQKNELKVIEIQSDITFKPDQTEFRPEAKNILERISNYVNRFPNSQWRIEGHTDNVNNEPEGLTLRRAEAVKQYLVSKGAKEKNFTVVDLGDQYPIERNTRAYGRMKNRRIVLKKMD